VSKRDRPELPLFALGAGALHLIALALLLPLLITLPGRGRDMKPEPVNIEVDIGSPAASRPIVPDVSSFHPARGEETAALPAESQPSDTTQDTLARVSPDTEPAAEEEQENAPAKSEPALTAKERKVKPKPEAKGQAKLVKPAPKVVRTQPRKPFFAFGKSSRPLFAGGRTAHSNAQGTSWGALFNAPH
jgi:hypothetical protein